MKRTTQTLFAFFTLASACLLQPSHAGLLQTQSNPVSGGFNPLSLASWDGIPQFPTEPAGDATAEGYDWFYTQVAHNNEWIFVRYHNSHQFAGDRQLMYLDTDTNRNTGLPGWTGNLAIGAERYLDGAAVKDSSGNFVDWTIWNNVQDGSGNWDIMVAVNRAQFLPGIARFDFVNQNHGAATDDWYPNNGNSGAGGDFFRYDASSSVQTAGTLLTFDALPAGQLNNSAIAQSFGDNAAFSSPGVVVTSNGTPNIALSWRAFGGTGTPRWDYYLGSVWAAAQLNDADVGAYYDLVFTPRGPTRVVIDSFNLHGYYTAAEDNNLYGGVERFSIAWEIWSGNNLKASGNYSFLSDGTKNHNVPINYTGDAGEELVLSINRVSSTLAGGEVEGDRANLAVDDISFNQITVTENASPGSTEYSNYVLRDAPLAYYRLGETTPPAEFAINSGTIGSAGNGYHTFGVLAPVAGALAGTSDRAARYPKNSAGEGQPTLVPYHPALNTAVFTAEAWVKPTLTTDDSAGPCPLFNRKSDGARQGWALFQRSPTTGYNLRMYGNGVDGSATVSITGGSYVVGEWTHLAISYDGSTARLYLNGVQVASGNPSAYQPNSSQPLGIGAYSDLHSSLPGYQNGFIGLIDEVAFNTNALSAGQLLAHYQNGTNASRSTPYPTLILSENPAEYLRFEDGTFALNSGTLGSAANGTDAHTANGVLGPQPPAYRGFESTNRAAGFDGYNSYINLGNPAGLNFAGAISLEAWAKPATVQGTFGNIIAHGVNAAGNAEVMLRITDGNRYQLGSWDGANHGTEFALPDADKSGTNWVHLVGTHDGSNWKLYRNGLLVASAADATGSLLVNDADWAIGASGDPRFVNGFRGFDGAIDEVAIYNYALSSNQVVAHYVVSTNGPLLSITSSGANVTLTWPAGTLQQADQVTGPYTDVVATSPYTIPASGSKFYRVKL
jgi:hypothetical protein